MRARLIKAVMKGGREAALLRLIYQLIAPFWQPWRTYRALTSVPWFLGSLWRYRASSRERVPLLDLYPNLNDRFASAGAASGHYFHQDLWAARKVFRSGRKCHVDVGSRVDGFVAHCATFATVEFVDLRPMASDTEGIEWRQGDILKLPFASESIESLSSLHVVEHIGLGRYGDPINPDGTRLALSELQRVLAVGGHLYLGLPIGRARVCFNAHRIFKPSSILDLLPELKLVSFSAVDDAGVFVASPSLKDFDEANYACGLFHLTRP